MEFNTTWRKVMIVMMGLVGSVAVLLAVDAMLRGMPLPDVGALSDAFWHSAYISQHNGGFMDMVANQLVFAGYLLMHVWILWLVPLGALLTVVVLLNRPATHAEMSQYLERVHMLEQTLKDVSERGDSYAVNWDLLNRKLDELFDGTPEVWLVIDPAKGVRRWNRNAVAMVRTRGKNLDGLEGLALTDVLPGAMGTPLDEAVKACAGAQKVWYGEIQDAQLGMWFLVWVFPLGGSEVAIVMRDVSHEHRDESSLKSSEKLLRMVVQNSARPLAVLDSDWRYLYLSQSWGEVMGTKAAVGQDHRQAMPDFPPNLKAVQQQLDGGHSVGRDEERRNVNGREMLLSWKIWPWRDALGQPGGYIISAADQTELVRLRQQVGQAEERENALAYSDALTGLPNRQLFNDRLNMALAQAYRQLGKVALLFLDLDGFKGVNDNLGHDYGDLLLKQVAQRLQECVRTTDTVARLGGDEFTIILAIRDRSDAERVAAKILESIRRPYDLNGKVADKVGTSIGVALYPQDGSQAADLMRKADGAMYASKQAGKNTYRFAADVEAGPAPAAVSVTR